MLIEVMKTWDGRHGRHFPQGVRHANRRPAQTQRQTVTSLINHNTLETQSTLSVIKTVYARLIYRVETIDVWALEVRFEAL